MNSRSFTILMLCLGAILACSPTAVLTEIFGNATPTIAEPTRAAQIETPIPRATETIALATPTSTPKINPALPTNTRPPALPLRTDLPALALRDFPRPANDNGRCIHFLPRGYYSARDFDIQIPRLIDLQMRWALVLYSDENQLRLAATRFKAAGIVPIWRKVLRAYQVYSSWDRDIQILKEIGVPLYFQIYNEADSDEEWDGRPVNRAQWIANMVQASKDVYNAGGFVGIQVLDDEWLTALLREIKARQGERIFTRMFFVPHPYALNHPPDYTQDENSVLGFRSTATVFEKEIGFVPPFIAGEGGWKYKATDDNRYPMIDDKLHAKYHVELFNWFRLGIVSDKQPLPDYLFAFCPWIFAGELEGAAWYDSFEGERTLTIAEVKKIPIFTRKFSWDKK
ncbi:MAG: hypothetical protein HY070_13610 [Chloroflexi bacterium]|nr:hypothetical protein [Chloroflexota bacterium]